MRVWTGNEQGDCIAGGQRDATELNEKEVVTLQRVLQRLKRR